MIEIVGNDPLKLRRFWISGRKDVPLRQRELPKLLPVARHPTRLRNSAGLHFSDEQMRQMARRWHIEHPEFVMGVLKQTNVIQGDTPDIRAQVVAYIREATEIGMFSKADVTQYTIACLNAGGSIAHVATFREVLVQFTEDTPDVMAQIIAAAPVHYWTYLPSKVRKT